MPRVKKVGADFANRSDTLLAEALRASEQRLQDILDNTTAVIFVKDLELRYILINREYERRFRVQRDQIRGKPTSTFILMRLPKQSGQTIVS